ncbi:hypothetical protein HK102_006209 [Quaeritorhiza haematococci]|nr:hypothetical protein HK102_006209 [Quaeritorhiza haematococci]
MATTERILFAGIPEEDFRRIHVTALASLSVSYVAEIYVFIRVLLLIREDKRLRLKRFKIRHLLALNLSIADFMFNVPHGIDHIISLSQGYVLSNMPGCLTIAFFTSVGFMAIHIWAMVIAVYTLGLIVFQYEIPAGKYGWRLLLVGWGLPLLFVLITIRNIGAAKNDLFCFLTGSDANLYFKGIGIFLGWVSSAACYIAIIVKILLHASTYKKVAQWRSTIGTMLSNHGSDSAASDASGATAKTSMSKEEGTVADSNRTSMVAPKKQEKGGKGGEKEKKEKKEKGNNGGQLFYKASATLFITLMVYIITWLSDAVFTVFMFKQNGPPPAEITIWNVAVANLSGLTNGT